MSTIGWIAIAERSGLTKEELKAFPHLMKWVDRIKVLLVLLVSRIQYLYQRRLAQLLRKDWRITTNHKVR